MYGPLHQNIIKRPCEHAIQARFVIKVIMRVPCGAEGMGVENTHSGRECHAFIVVQIIDFEHAERIDATGVPAMGTEMVS